MKGVLLDTHAFYWSVTETHRLSDDALLAIVRAQVAGTLFVSPISLWELTTASLKAASKNPTSFAGEAPKTWFRKAVSRSGGKIIPIGQKIAVDAAELVALTGHRDPGDCFLMATARIRRIPIVTRDTTILKLAEAGILAAIEC